MKKDTIKALKGHLDWPDLFSSIKYKIEFDKEHPDWFVPDGIIVFTGSQGTGKTLSAVRYVVELMEEYPKVLLCTNVQINKFEDRQVWFDSVSKFKELDNGEYGVIYLIDEIQLLFNSLESKNLDLNLFTTICQQRNVNILSVLHRCLIEFLKVSENSLNMLLCVITFLVCCNGIRL